MGMKKIRFAVVGCGHMGAQAELRVQNWATGSWWSPLSYASAVQSHPQAQLVGLCDQSPEQLKKVEKLWNVPTYSNFQKMLKKENPDVLCVATRTPGRMDLLKTAVQSGIHGFLCEKPLCNSVNELENFKKLFGGNKVAFAYGARRRYAPIYQKARELLKSGVIGKLESIICEFGVGRLFWTHPHGVDLANFFVDDTPVNLVQAHLEDISPRDQKTGKIDSDPFLNMGHIHYKNGVKALLVSGGGSDIRLLGSEGSLSVVQDGAKLLIREKAKSGSKAALERSDAGWLLQETSLPNMDRHSATYLSVDCVIRALQKKNNKDVSPRVAIQNQEILFGFAESGLRNGELVSLKEVRKNLVITGKHPSSLFA